MMSLVSESAEHSKERAVRILASPPLTVSQALGIGSLVLAPPPPTQELETTNRFFSGCLV